MKMIPMRLSICFLLFFRVAVAQGDYLTGIIKDAVDKTPLEGVHVLNQSDGGTFTQTSGWFKLYVSVGDTLHFSYLGYQNQTLIIREGDSHIEVLLIPQEVQMEVEVVVKTSPIRLAEPIGLGILEQESFLVDEGISLRAGLNRIPGVFMQSGTHNTNRISIRGVGSRSSFGTSKIRLYLDDIPLTSGDGSSAIEDIDPILLETIKVIKGPSAGSFGAGLGGVIQLNPYSRLSNQPLKAEVSYQWGDYQTQRAVYRIRQSSEKVAFQFLSTQTKSDGWRQNSSYNRDILFGSLQLKGENGSDTRFLFNRYVNLAYIPSSINFDDFTQNPWKAAGNWLAMEGYEDYEGIHLGLTHTTAPIFENDQLVVTLKLGGFAGNHQNFEPRPFNTLREQSTVLGSRSYLQGIGKDEDHWLRAFQIGWEAYRQKYLWTTHQASDQVLTSLLSDNQEYRTYYNFFGTWDWNLGPRWFLLTGFNYNRTVFDYTDFFLQDGVDGSGIKKYGGVFSPRISFGYSLGQGITLYGGISHGFSPPSLEETLLPNGAINPDIQPEKGWSIEIGSRGKMIGQKWDYDITFYRMSIYDLLVSKRVEEDQYLGLNAGLTQHLGVETLVQFNPNNHWQLYWSHHFTKYTFEDFVDGENDYSGNPLTGVAPHTLQTGVRMQLPFGLKGILFYEYVDKMPMRDDNSVNSAAYSVVNGRLTYDWRLGEILQLELYAGMNNILDVAYAGMILVNAASFGSSQPRYYYPGLPRNSYGGIKVTVEFP